MKPTYLSALIVSATVAAAPATAQNALFFGADAELAFSQANTTITVTPFLEYATDFGLYFGADIANIDSPDDNFLMSFYIGFGDTSGPWSYGISYAEYYLDQSGGDGEELVLQLGYRISDDLRIATAIVDDMQQSTRYRQSFRYAMTADFDVSGAYTFGEQQNDDTWNIGASTALTDQIALDLRYYDAEASDPSVAILLSYVTDISDRLP